MDGMSSPTVFCPSCGDEYVAGSQVCSECRVALVADRPTIAGRDASDVELPPGFVELGVWPRLATIMLLRRLEDAGVSVLTHWAGTGPASSASLAVPEAEADFADAVIRELPVDEELPESRDAHLVADRIETRLAEVALLLDELRDRLGPGA
jgi:hypothetical protein